MGSVGGQGGLGQGDLETGRQGDESSEVLPESISTQTSTDVQTPTDLSSSNPNDITPPETGTLPPLGTTPSDNPTEVQLPADLSSSPLPPIETGVQVLEVAPPEGWVPEGEEDSESGIGVFGDVFGDGNATCNYHRTCTPDDKVYQFWVGTFDMP